MRKLMFLLGLCPIVFLYSCKTTLTPQQRQENVQKIEQADFIFYPTRVTPTFSVSHTISRPCSLRIANERLEAALPYLGHFYVRPVNPRQDIPIKFYSHEFVYVVEFDPSDSTYHVTITPQDVTNIMNSNLVVHLQLKDDGNGRMTIDADNRDQIMYEGYYR